MRVLGVVLYLAVLLCFFNNASAAVNCGQNGHTSPLADVCICNSGYFGALCGNTLNNATCHPAAVEATTANNFPTLNTTANVTKFTRNTLHAELDSENVKDRSYLELAFKNVTNNDKCKLGSVGSYWVKEENDCKDRFTLALPWDQHVSCGFVVNVAATNEDKLVLTAPFYIKYVDPIVDAEFGDYDLNRTVSVPYTISVTFQRKIEVTLLTLNITSDVHFGVALTGDEFGPDTRELALELTTIINWPNVFHPTGSALHKNYIETPTHVVAVPKHFGKDNTDPNWSIIMDVVSNANIGTAECSLIGDTCKQTWTIAVKINDSYVGENNCTFDGAYALHLELYTCRGGSTTIMPLDCTSTLSVVNFTLSTSDVCGQVGITPTVKGELLAFKDAFSYEQMADPANVDSAQTRFKLGEWAKFYADIESDGNDITLDFTDVRFAVKTGATVNETEWMYLWKNNSATGNTDLVEHAVNVHVDVQNAMKGFRLYFHSSVFKVQPDKEVTFVISAKAEITFAGNENDPKNRKRSIEYVYEASSTESSTKVGISNPSGVVAPAPGADKQLVGSVDQTTFIASVVGAVAGTMIIVFVVVGLALRVRNQSEKRDAPASAAVSAANAAAATIEIAVNRA